MIKKLLHIMKKKFKDLEDIIKMEIMTIKSAEKLLENESKIVELDQQLIGRLSRMDSIRDNAMSIAKLQRQRQRLHQLEDTLININKENFGICIDCGEDIEIQRLKINPIVRKCFECMRG